MLTLRPISIVLAFVSLTASAALAAESAEEFYRGKQIRLIVSTDAGGAYDTYARLSRADPQGSHPRQSDRHRAEHARRQRAEDRELHVRTRRRATAPSSPARIRAC